MKMQRQTHLFFHGDLQQQQNRAGQVFEVANEFFRGFPNGGLGREGLLQYNMQLLHVHCIMYTITSIFLGITILVRILFP